MKHSLEFIRETDDALKRALVMSRHISTLEATPVKLNADERLALAEIIDDYARLFQAESEAILQRAKFALDAYARTKGTPQ
jgi:hypothetical protein